MHVAMICFQKIHVRPKHAIKNLDESESNKLDDYLPEGMLKTQNHMVLTYVTGRTFKIEIVNFIFNKICKHTNIYNIEYMRY